MVRIALVATVRNEGPFLLEWIAYHRTIGFTDILVCSNDCADGSAMLLDALQERGMLTHLPCTPRPDEKAQLHAYARAETHLAGRWPDALMVLDADEFLNIHIGDGTIPELLDAVPDATAMLINWRIFGSAGHRCRSAEPVIERYRMAAPRYHGVNRSFKTLFRHPDAYHCPLLPHGPGFARAERLHALRAVDGAGRPLPERFVRSEAFLQSEEGGVSWALAQVNHYNTRSRQDYLVKHHRGGGLGPARWDREANWAAFNRNEERDDSIQRHLPRLKAALAGLLRDSLLRERHERCLDLYGRHVESLAEAA